MATTVEALIRMKADTSGVKKATRDIDDLTQSAKETKREIEAASQSTKKIDKNLQDAGSQARDTANAIKSTGRSFKDLDLSASSASTKLDNSLSGYEKFRKTLNGTGNELEDLGKKSANNVVPFRAQKGALSNLSFQLQDVAVQAQAGTDAMIILGQQGPQIASIFGPGGAVAGAIVAFGALIAGVAMKMGATEMSAEDLREEIEDLGEEFNNLTAAQQAFVRSQRLERIEEMEAQLRLLNNELAKAESMSYGAAGGMTAMAGGVTAVSDADPEMLRAQIDGLTQSLQREKEALDGRSMSAQDMIEDLKEQIELVGANAKAEALYQAELNGASGEQLRQIGNLYDILAAREAVIEAEKTSREEADKTVENLDRLMEGLREEERVLGQSARAKALYTAAANGASEAQIAEINALFDSIDAKNKEIAAIKEADRLKAEEDAKEESRRQSARENLKQVLAMNDTEMEAFNRSMTEKRARLDEDLANERISKAEHERAMTEITEAEANKRAEIEKRLAAESTARLLELSDQLLAGKSDNAKAAAAVAINLANKEKRENAKQIISDSYTAAMKAYKALSGIPIVGPALGAAAAGAIIAAGVSYSAKSLTGRALGGQVRPGESYVVGERGPEVLTMGNAGGRIATNESMRGAQPSLVYSPTVNITGGATEQDRALFTAQLRQQKAEIADLLARRRF